MVPSAQPGEHIFNNWLKPGTVKAREEQVRQTRDQILDALTRGLDPDVLSRGYGEEGRGVIVSYQAQSPVLGAVLRAIRRRLSI